VGHGAHGSQEYASFEQNCNAPRLRFCLVQKKDINAQQAVQDETRLRQHYQGQGEKEDRSLNRASQRDHCAILHARVTTTDAKNRRQEPTKDK
jgi:hypothetical protein